MIVWLPKAVGNSLKLKTFLLSRSLFFANGASPVQPLPLFELRGWSQFSCAALRVVEKGSATSAIHSFRFQPKNQSRASLSNKHLASGRCRFSVSLS
jgi:hypothetical protein